MEPEEIIGQATHRLSTTAEGFSLTPIETRDEAEDVLAAVLRTLSEQLPAEDAARLADRLPDGLDVELPEAGTQADYSLEDFFEQVTDRSSVEHDPEAVSYYARVVLSLLYDAGIAGDGLDLESALPAEYDPLFEFVHGEGPWDKYEDTPEDPTESTLDQQQRGEENERTESDAGDE